MTRFAYLLAGVSCLFAASIAEAQLPSNPWQPVSQVTPASKIEAMGRQQAAKAKALRAAQIRRASTQLQQQRMVNDATPAAIAEAVEAAEAEVESEAIVDTDSDLATDEIVDAELTTDAVVEVPAQNTQTQAQAPSPGDGYMGDNVASLDITKAPVYANTSHGADILPVDPWARARDKSGIQTWRGSGQHGKLNYIGEATTYGTAMGQEMIAPEVNRHNMLVFMEHLRSLGYKIPDSYDQKLKDLPQNYAAQLHQAYDSVGHGNNPFDTIFAGFLDIIEDTSGLDIENLLFNSIDLLATD